MAETAAGRSLVTRGRTIAFVVPAALGALFLVLFVARLPEPLGVDQGLFACFTRWVPRGALPYRDLFDSKPPLFLYFWALARVVPGEVPRNVWWFEGIWLCITCCVAYSLGARLHGRVAGIATAALLFIGLWSPAFGGYWSRAQAEEVLALPMLLSALASVRARERERWALTAGVLAGICGLFKIPSMAIALAWAIGWFALMPLRAAARRSCWLLLGVSLPWLFACAWFSAHGAFRQFLDGTFVYHRYNAEFISPPWSELVVRFVTTLGGGTPLALVAAAFGLVLHLRRRAREGAWLAAWVACTLTAIVLQRQLAGYHFLLAAPALAMAGGYAIGLLVRAARSRGRPRIVGGLGLVALAVVAAQTVWNFAKAYAPGIEHLVGRTDRSTYLQRIRHGRMSQALEEALARHVRERTLATEGIFIYGQAPAVYALADRHPTTRYPFHKVLFTDAPFSRMMPGLEGRRAELLAQLARDPPMYVIVGHNDSNPFDPMPSDFSLVRFAALNDWVQRDYAFETTIGSFTLYRRKRAP